MATQGRRSVLDALSPGILPPTSPHFEFLLSGSCCPFVCPLPFQAGGHVGDSTLVHGHPPLSAKPTFSGKDRWPGLPFKVLRLSQNLRAEAKPFHPPKAGELCPELGAQACTKLSALSLLGWVRGGSGWSLLRRGYEGQGQSPGVSG